jgi:hypothetical protein
LPAMLKADGADGGRVLGDVSTFGRLRGGGGGHEPCCMNPVGAAVDAGGGGGGGGGGGVGDVSFVVAIVGALTGVGSLFRPGEFTGDSFIKLFFVVTDKKEIGTVTQSVMTFSITIA